MKLENLLFLPLAIVVSTAVLDVALVRADNLQEVEEPASPPRLTNDLPGMVIEGSTGSGMMVNPFASEVGRLLPSKKVINDHVVTPVVGGVLGGLSNPSNPVVPAAVGAGGTCVGCHFKLQDEQR
jgi:hypothetical protein